jgi:hypothetical protein
MAVDTSTNDTRCSNTSNGLFYGNDSTAFTVVVTIVVIVFVLSLIVVLFVNIVLLVSVLGDKELRRGGLTPLVVSLSASDILMTVCVITLIAIETMETSSSEDDVYLVKINSRHIVLRPIINSFAIRKCFTKFSQGWTSVSNGKLIACVPQQTNLSLPVTC